MAHNLWYANIVMDGTKKGDRLYVATMSVTFYFEKIKTVCETTAVSKVI